MHSFIHACIGLIFNSCIYLCVFAYASHTFPSVYHLPARCVCMCIFCLRVSFRGHSGCFYPDRYNTFLYKLKKKKAVVHPATELSFRLHWGLVPCYAYLKASQAARPPWRGSKHSLTPWLTSNLHIPSLTCPCFHRSRLETEARGVKSLRLVMRSSAAALIFMHLTNKSQGFFSLSKDMSGNPILEVSQRSHRGIFTPQPTAGPDPVFPETFAEVWKLLWLDFNPEKLS